MAAFGRHGRYVRGSLTLSLLALVVSTSSTTDAAVARFAAAPSATASFLHLRLQFA